MNKAKSKTMQRFPRMKGITPKVRLIERLLHQTYNTLAKGRNAHLRGNLSRNPARMHHYDLYRTKQGKRAPFNFLVLGIELADRNIDPSLYLKVMSQYGQWSRSRYLPHPTWLASDKALEIFEWKYQRERKKYELESDWKRALRGHHEEDIVKAVYSSANMIQLAMETFQMGEAETVLMLKDELSPWFLAGYLPARKEYAEELEAVLRSEDDLYTQSLLCLRHYDHNRPTWQEVRKIIQRIS
jgi:hypothetical protein